MRTFVGPSPPAMKLQMVDLHAQVAALRPELDAAYAAVLESGAFVRGPFVSAFEEEFAAWVASTGDGLPQGEPLYALGVGNGTDALQIALMALGVGPGDAVITSPFTFVATAEAAALLGARPVFVDIEPDTFNLDPALLDAAITARTKAIVPVHLFGQPAKMDLLLALAEERGIPVVEDAAQAIGATWRGRPAGTMAAFGTISFYPSKNLSAFGDGGAILTTDPARFAEAKSIANHGAERKYYHERVGINSRLDALQAAFLSVKLRHLAAWTAARQAVAEQYDALFAGSAFAIPPARDPGATHVFHQYTLRVPADARDDLATHLKAKGIPTMVYYPVPLHRLPVFEELGYAEGSLPEAERASREVLSLPMHPDLTPEQVRYVAGAVRAFAGEALAEALVPA
ncbi:MAG TPA: DegT/DnrJ/EryC1/StrS family aminotransferase [Rubricoccaceae bacterium]|nr:DegT/DnrJ/EryC1/StrS family aminotransferase [Rubricoccaceae bacterium]